MFTVELHTMNFTEINHQRPPHNEIFSSLSAATTVTMSPTGRSYGELPDRRPGLQTFNIDMFREVLLRIIVPLIYGLMSVVGTIGNALVVYVILSKHQMRTVTNVLLLNLAITDLCFVLIIPSMTAYTMSTESRWRLGDVACKLMHYVINVTAYVTVYTLVLVSAVRYMTVVHGVTTARLRTVRNIVAMIIGLWVVMLLVNCPVLNAYNVTYFSASDRLVCTEESKEVGKRIFATFFTFGYIVPLTVIAALSLSILRYISKHHNGLTSTSTTLNAGANARSSARKRQASRLLILVVVIFAVLWLPLNLHLLAFHFGLVVGENRIYDALSIVFNCLAYSNSCVNPFIYDHMSKDFRDAFREVMHCSSSEGDNPGGVPVVVAADNGGRQDNRRNDIIAAGLKQQQQQQQHMMMMGQLTANDNGRDGGANTAVVALQTRVELNGFSENGDGVHLELGALRCLGAGISDSPQHHHNGQL